MKCKMTAILLVSHLAVAGLGFAGGIYLLPILTAEKSASYDEIAAVKAVAKYTGTFSKNQKGSDALHWVDGKLYVSGDNIAFEGKIAPGPDYKIYLTKEQANDKETFLAMKDQAVLIGSLKNFDNFVKKIPEHINPDEYTTVQIWCERFSQFIGSAKYKN
ncbi:MAG: DM13 domain-containing protein [Enterobacteriaceae bacterium]